MRYLLLLQWKLKLTSTETVFGFGKTDSALVMWFVSVKNGGFLVQVGLYNLGIWELVQELYCFDVLLHPSSHLWLFAVTETDTNTTLTGRQVPIFFLFFLFFSAYSYFSYFLAISSYFSYSLAILLTIRKYLLQI